MIKFLFLIFLLMTGISNASANTFTWFNSGNDALAACQQSLGSSGCNSGQWGGQSRCVNGSALFFYHWVTPSTNANYFLTCTYGFTACPVANQTREVPGSGECFCPAGQVLVGGACVPEIPSCTSMGVDVNSFVAKCSEMIDGSPTQCLNSDNTPFAIQGCPTLNCSDGSTTVYPTPCPVTACPDGFTLSDVAGVGKTCIMPLPDDDQSNPCVSVSGSDDPLCATNGKNCQLVNGAYICLKETPITDVPAGATCYDINSKKYCLSNQPVIETEKTVTSNPDGSTTIREVMTPSVQGASPRIKETTINPDGSETVISNNPGDLTDLGLQPQPTQKIDLSKVEKNTKDTADNTASILDLLTGFFDLPSDVEAIDESSIEFPGLQTAIDSDLSAFEGFVNEPNPMKAYYDSNPFAAAFTSMLPSDTSCGYVLETSIFGKSFRLAPCEKLEPLREILAWFFSILTAWQIVNITAKSIVRF